MAEVRAHTLALKSVRAQGLAATRTGALEPARTLDPKLAPTPGPGVGTGHGK